MSDVRVFGIRHHGPGSARSLRAALEAYEPDAILLEGPPDADDLLALAAHEEMKPPVAILVYVPDKPQQAVFYPFASFSPEWVAIRYALANDVPVRFMDLPQFHALAIDAADAEATEGAKPSPSSDAPVVESSPGAPSGSLRADDDADPGANEAGEVTPELWQDPLGRLAQVAGFDDGERWWDHLVESRRDAKGAVFEAIADAMAVLREDAVASPHHGAEREAQREAYMRKTIRSAISETRERIAVVCGAWHAPALRDVNKKGLATADNASLKGLPKIKTAAAWTPWSYDRLSYRSSYGAGVASPAYYDLLWTHERHVAIHWFTRAARLLRKQDLDTSSAHIIESVRLAETLAALRGRPQAGLEELIEAALAVLCSGNDAPMQLIRRKLIVGDRLGDVPEDVPATPLQQDLKALQKRLRMPASADEKDYDLDLRKPNDLERSHLLHRLRLLSIPWGELGEERGKKGTFHEFWRVAWKPEFVVDLIAAAPFGNTIEAAASAVAIQRARGADSLRSLVELLGDALLADLPEAMSALTAAVQQLAAVGSDVPQLMDALPPLARIGRYGNVRQSDAAVVLTVVDGLLMRICVGLPAAAASLDDDAARQMFARVNAVTDSVGLLQNDAHRGQWLAVLCQLADQAGLHALVTGRAVRLLHDGDAEPAERTGRRLSLALSTGNDPAYAAHWIEGFLSGSGALLLHDEAIWSLTDEWVCSLSPDHFMTVLPLLRRTFSTFHAPERRQLGERVTQSARGGSRPPVLANDFDYEAANAALPLLAKILGVEAPFSERKP